MQICQSYLTVKMPILGNKPFLGMNSRLLLIKESDVLLNTPKLLNSKSAIKPLVNYSKLLIFRQTQPLIDSDAGNTQNWHENFNFDGFIEFSSADLSNDRENIDSLNQDSNIDNFNNSLITNHLPNFTPDIRANFSPEPTDNVTIAKPEKDDQEHSDKKSTYKKSKPQLKTEHKTKSKPKNQLKFQAPVNADTREKSKQLSSQNQTQFNLNFNSNEHSVIVPNTENTVISENLVQSEQQIEIQEIAATPLVATSPISAQDTKIDNVFTTLNHEQQLVLPENLPLEKDNIGLTDSSDLISITDIDNSGENLTDAELINDEIADKVTKSYPEKQNRQLIKNENNIPRITLFSPKFNLSDLPNNHLQEQTSLSRTLGDEPEIINTQPLLKVADEVNVPVHNIDSSSPDTIINHNLPPFIPETSDNFAHKETHELPISTSQPLAEDKLGENLDSISENTVLEPPNSFANITPIINDGQIADSKIELSSSNQEILTQGNISDIDINSIRQKPETTTENTTYNFPNIAPDVLISQFNVEDNATLETVFRHSNNEATIAYFEQESHLTTNQSPAVISANVAGKIPESPKTDKDTLLIENVLDVPEISPHIEKNTTFIFDNLPAPTGFATGGLVAASQTEDHPQIAASDTVPAMLTPGEFVINARDAQKNINLLHHINSGGGLPEEVIFSQPQISKPQQEVEVSTKADSETQATTAKTVKSDSVQRKNSDVHLPKTSDFRGYTSLGLDIDKYSSVNHTSLQFNNFEQSADGMNKNHNNYSSPPLIFRKSKTANVNANINNPPAQWSSVEELLNGSTNEFTTFNFDALEFSQQNLESSANYQSPKILPKRIPYPQGFADGGEVTAPDIATNIEPITETIQNNSAAEQSQEDVNNPDLETLAREIYSRLRQRLEIERERHGISLGRLPW